VKQTRAVFFISDRTGITAEVLGHSLLSQFDSISFSEITIPFVDTLEKAQEAVKRINQLAIKSEARPVVLSTLVDPAISEVVASADALFLDCFRIFIAPLEQELATKSSHAVGRSHSARDAPVYRHRIDAVNYALAHDDGLKLAGLEQADVVLIGVSRCGKTPTCLYMALQFGIRAANYPLTQEDLSSTYLPTPITPYRDKLYGLTIDPMRLQQIRYERRPVGQYATIETCESEVKKAELLMQYEHIPYIDTTTKSIEELAVTILHQSKLTRRIY
jgi:[pyruvate, water dikinase]-phosphate phosphotransferase / [pyruvate, water dikinase] kinase